LEFRQRELERLHAKGDLDNAQFHEEQQKLLAEIHRLRSHVRGGNPGDPIRREIKRHKRRMSIIREFPDGPKRRDDIRRIERVIKELNDKLPLPRRTLPTGMENEQELQVEEQRQRFRDLANRHRERAKSADRSSGPLLLFLLIACGALIVILHRTLFRHWRRKRSEWLPSALDPLRR
jgi:hypothetical protein